MEMKSLSFPLFFIVFFFFLFPSFPFLFVSPSCTWVHGKLHEILMSRTRTEVFRGGYSPVGKIDGHVFCVWTLVSGPRARKVAKKWNEMGR